MPSSRWSLVFQRVFSHQTFITMKLLLLLPALCCFLTTGFAQKQTKTNQKANTKNAQLDQSKSQKTACCTYVIDYIAPNGDLVSNVWEPLPTNERNKCTQPVDIVVQHVVDGKRVNHEWNLCTLKDCPPVTTVRENATVARKNRSAINKRKYSGATPVIDLAGFAAGEYVIRATACNKSYETTVKIEDKGSLARPEAAPVKPRDTK
jgi:hypothetical protein